MNKSCTYSYTQVWWTVCYILPAL